MAFFRNSTRVAQNLSRIDDHFSRPGEGVCPLNQRNEIEWVITIGLPKGKMGSRAWRYKQLLHDLRTLSDRELRWVLIARWLQEEGVCGPQEFLPPEVLERILKKLIRDPRKPRVSFRDTYYLWLVRIWIPYFERLLRDRDGIQTRRNPQEKLIPKGYSQDTIEATLGKHSAVQCVVSWLEQRKHIDARTLDNAYSRGQVKLRKPTNSE